MSEYMEIIKVGNFLYGNVYIQNIELNEAEEYLRIQVCSADHERQSILYHELYYSQIDLYCQGKKISTAEEIKVQELLSPRYAICYQKFCLQSSVKNNGFIKELVQRGYRLFLHYTQSMEEFLVIAKRVDHEVY